MKQKVTPCSSTCTQYLIWLCQYTTISAKNQKPKSPRLNKRTYNFFPHFLQILIVIWYWVEILYWLSWKARLYEYEYEYGKFVPPMLQLTKANIETFIESIILTSKYSRARRICWCACAKTFVSVRPKLGCSYSTCRRSILLWRSFHCDQIIVIYSNFLFNFTVAIINIYCICRHLQQTHFFMISSHWFQYWTLLSQLSFIWQIK